MRVETVRELADRRGRGSPVRRSAPTTYGGSTDPASFIDQYGDGVQPAAATWTSSAGSRDELCEDLAAQGVRYAEVVFSPAQHAAVWATGSDRSRRCSTGSPRASGTPAWSCGWSPTSIRDYGMEQAEEVLQVALKYAGARRRVAQLRRVASGPPIAPYADIFRRGGGGRLPLHAARRRVERAARTSGTTLEHLAPRAHRPRRALDRRSRGSSSISPSSAIPLEVCPIVQRRHRRVRVARGPSVPAAA